MNRVDAAAWLQNSGGPIIRYLLNTEQYRGIGALAELECGLLVHKRVQYWLGCITGRTGFNQIHGSKDTCFENAVGKLALFGLRKGMGKIEERFRPYMRWLHKSGSAGERNVIGVFMRTLVASMLALAGYIQESLVREMILKRLDVIDAFVRKGDYSIYTDKKRFRRIAKSFAHYPLVRPDLYPGGDFALPWIYDILAFRVLYARAERASVKNKIDRVISYIMQPAYQKLHDGYGIVCTAENRYNVMGWNVWLPGYSGMHVDDFKMSCLIQRVELLSDFKIAVSDHWFTNSVQYLKEYATGRGTYLVPKHYIREKKDSYFVAGAHMGLGENRRCKLAHEIESTYWVTRIISKIEKRTGKGQL
jgi:hypothetical protein